MTQCHSVLLNMPVCFCCAYVLLTIKLLLFCWSLALLYWWEIPDELWNWNCDVVTCWWVWVIYVWIWHSLTNRQCDRLSARASRTWKLFPVFSSSLHPFVWIWCLLMNSGGGKRPRGMRPWRHCTGGSIWRGIRKFGFWWISVCTAERIWRFR